VTRRYRLVRHPKKIEGAVSPSRLGKRLSRALKVTWREQPNRYDIEALHDNVRRVGVVIRVRWALVFVLFVYSVFGAVIYMQTIPFADLARLMSVPALALVLVLAYNTFYQLTYRRFANVAIFNHAQLLLDALVVTILVYYSGGIESWFWAMYPLFVLEAAFILPRRLDAWLIAIACAAMLGAVTIAEYLTLLPHIEIPFSNLDVHSNATYVSVRYLWQVAVIFGTASVATLLVSDTTRATAATAITDTVTGLYSRAYYRQILPTEIGRARRDMRGLHLIFIDLDRFTEYNERFGIEAGDQLLAKVGVVVADSLGSVDARAASTNVAARIGGEEFAIVLTEAVGTGSEPSRQDALALAEQLRATICSTTVNDAGATASIGVASLPDDGSSSQELTAAADEGLLAAVEAGGNRVGTPARVSSDSDGDEPSTRIGAAAPGGA
jgi:diguanylate cyclase (GGDEF)-like protein